MTVRLIEQKIESLPARPGVYLFKDREGTVLYVGKAGHLRQRVASYFQRMEEKDAKTLALLEKVIDVETIVTDTEKEALILEDNLIKEHHPRYNIKLRDDKRYPCLRLSMEEDFPTLTVVRRIKRDRSLYFGPYPSATSLKETLKLIRRLFPIRTCQEAKFLHRTRPCINYEMERCLGPCCGKIDRSQYGEVIQQVKLFLEGRNRDLIERLERQMVEEADQLHFEKAARIRDQIKHIQKVVEKQLVLSRDMKDRDVIGFYRQDGRVALYSLFIRAGKLLGGKGFNLSSAGLPEEDILSSFIKQYYRQDRFIPEEILIPGPIPEKNLMEGWLTELKGKKVQLLFPQRGEKKRLLRMASENAEKFLHREVHLEREKGDFLLNLKESLRLSKLPKRIEAFDISNLQGSHAVGSMVTFEDGKPRKDRYRHFKIKTIEGADDYGMMYEILLRRYRRAIEEGDLPDLILLDGGKGHLHVAKEVLKELGMKGVDLLSLAKERRAGELHHSAEKSEEKIFHPQYKEPILLGKQSPVLRFLDQIRDEAHRFALTYHKKIRKKETLRSVLDEIPGIGTIRQRELLKYFGSVDQMKEATLEELQRVPHMNRNLAETVYHYFHPS